MMCFLMSDKELTTRRVLRRTEDFGTQYCRATPKENSRVCPSYDISAAISTKDALMEAVLATLESTRCPYSQT